MPGRFVDQTDIFAVITVHLGAIGISFLDIENGLKIASLVIAIAYTMRKWYLMEQAKKS